MTVFVASCGLLLALFAGIILDGTGVRRPQKVQRDVPLFDAWRW